MALGSSKAHRFLGPTGASDGNPFCQKNIFENNYNF
jgi:hypothetical protein